MTTPLLADLERAITERDQSFFAEDINHWRDAMVGGAAGSRVLVVGGGGSIGSATARALLSYRPAALHIVDVSENYLAELIREVRSGDYDLAGIDVQTHVFDYGSATMHRFLAGIRAFDVVLNFAAVKHVRSEKDIYSLLHMIDVNVVRHARFKRWLAEFGHTGRYFAVSTDKAANPVSLMGASKRVMEDVVFDVLPAAFKITSSARFANVAFSNGSLLHSFLVRIEKRQPLAVPRATRRYFISHAEAAEICLLASLVAPSGHLMVPRFDPAEHLLLLEDVATRVLSLFGYEPWFTDDEAAAKRGVATHSPHGRWPVLLTPLDTSGEKPYEEFIGEGEIAIDAGFGSLRGIPYRPGRGLERLLAELERFINCPDASVDKELLTRIVESAVPTMHHVETGRHLDQRM